MHKTSDKHVTIIEVFMMRKIFLFKKKVKENTFQKIRPPHPQNNIEM